MTAFMSESIFVICLLYSVSMASFCSFTLFLYFSWSVEIFAGSVSLAISALACSNVILSSTNNSAIEFISPILPFSKLLCIASSISDTLIFSFLILILYIIVYDIHK